MWLDHSQQQSLTFIKPAVLQTVCTFSMYPVALWALSSSHWIWWVWCHCFQWEAWFFYHSHSLLIFWSLLNCLILNHVLYSFVKNVILCLFWYCTFLSILPVPFSKCNITNSWWVHWRKLCFSVGLMFSPITRPSTDFFSHMFHNNFQKLIGSLIFSVLPNPCFRCANMKLTRFRQTKLV